MPHINLEEGYPGIRSLFMYSPATAMPDTISATNCRTTRSGNGSSISSSFEGLRLLADALSLLPSTLRGGVGVGVHSGTADDATPLPNPPPQGGREPCRRARLTTVCARLVESSHDLFSIRFATVRDAPADGFPPPLRGRVRERGAACSAACWMASDAIIKAASDTRSIATSRRPTVWCRNRARRCCCRAGRPSR